jgi:serine/threonine-protein kinase
LPDVETGTPTPEDLVGRVLGSRYRIEKTLKRGGMGQVYAAVDVDSSEENPRRVAVKVVRQSLIEDPQALARFKREARLVTELRHDNIVGSLAAGDDGGLLWIAMELLEGESLRERLDARGRMQWQETLPIIEQVVRALKAAHDMGVIHRDLKPENVMIVGEKAKLLDFGVAKQAAVDGETSNMTGTGLIVGTPGYVAPEVVLEGRTDDPRSDFYALGVTWFEMLTAQKPFTAKTAFALAMRHAHEPAPTPTSFVPYSPVPAPIEQLVLRLMAKNPDERPQNAGALLDALKNLADDSQRALANPTPPPHSLTPEQPTMTSTDLRGTPQHTDVVQFKTPSPKPSTSIPTPGTAMNPAGTPFPPGTPLPADFVSQFIASIPKKRIAAVATLAVLLVAGVIGVIVAVAIHFATPQTVVVSAPPIPTPLPVAPTPPPPTPPAPPAPPPLASTPIVEASAPIADATAKSPTTHVEKSTKRGAETKHDKAATPPVAVAPPNATAWVHFRSDGSDASVSVDGKIARNPPFDEELDASKPHSLQWTLGDNPPQAAKILSFEIGGTYFVTPTSFTKK